AIWASVRSRLLIAESPSGLRACCRAALRAAEFGTAHPCPTSNFCRYVRISQGGQVCSNLRQSGRIVDRRRHGVLRPLGDLLDGAADDLAGARLRQTLDDDAALERSNRS